MNESNEREAPRNESGGQGLPRLRLVPNKGRRPVHQAEAAIHLALLLVMLWWCFVMSLGSDLVHSNRGFSELAKWGTDGQWSWALLATSALGGVGLALRRFRMLSLVVLSMMHSHLAVLLSIGAHMSTGAGVYTVISMLAGYSVWREATR